MKYDFIEIGTSNFETLIENANDNDVGISIEPIKSYLNQLPNKLNVIKLNLAISKKNTEGTVKIFFIPENIIVEKKLPDWLRGCNSINDYHPTHKKLKLEEFVFREDVKEIPISKLFRDYKINQCDHLKIDTEGSDCEILLGLFSFLKENHSEYFFPKKITFETNTLTDSQKLSEVNFILNKEGYSLHYDEKRKNTVAILKS